MGRRIVKPGEKLPPECRKMRHFRAKSGKTQKVFCEQTGIDPGTYAAMELGLVVPDPDELERGASTAGLSDEYGDEVLLLDEIHERRRLWPGRSPGELFAEVCETIESHARQTWQSLLRLGPPATPPREEDRAIAREQLPRLAKLTPGQRAAVVKRGRDYRAWALAIETGEASEQAASRDPEEAAAGARRAREFAVLVEGPRGWREAVESHAAAYEANALRIPGKLKEARSAFEEAKQLARAGLDPYGLLDPGRLFDLEATLCRDERRFKESLKLADRAIAMGRCPGRVLIKKGATLTIMGDYGRAVETLREAEPKVQGDARLLYMCRFNLAVNLTFLGHGYYEEAAQHLQEVRQLAAERGDEVELLRVRWLEGRIEAGLGRRQAALLYLEQAQAGFEKRKMFYDVALAAMERAELLLKEGKTAEVKAMTLELTEVFGKEGVHHEAEKALRLFQEAAEREAATAELARRVLGFLFRAQHDPGLRFAGSAG